MNLHNLSVQVEPRASSPSQHSYAPPSPRLVPSGGVFSSPRIGHHRKTSSGTENFYPAPSGSVSPGIWPAMFPSGGRSPSLPYSNTPRRSFYQDSRGNETKNHPGSGTALSILRNLFLRPLYLVGRRGPLLPLIAIIAIVVIVVTYSTNPSTQSVKRRVQGAVGPYIPQRAADAINWRVWQAPLKVNGDKSGSERDELRFGGKGRDGPKKKKPFPFPSNPPLPPARPDGRILIESGKKHPIPGLMARAKVQWSALQAKQSKSFAEAVKEYVKRNGYNPPAGFDKWFVQLTAFSISRY